MSKKHYKPFLLGKKLGMTQVFDSEGNCHAVTVLDVGPCMVTQLKTGSKEGYNAVQIGYDAVELRKVNKPDQGHFKKNKLKSFKFLREFRLDDLSGIKTGEELDLRVFEEGERVDVTGISKGKGFQGVIKRHHKGGGPASHGSHFHRSTGSIGQRTWPGRVFKLMKLPGHMGVEKVTVKNLEILSIDNNKNRVLLKGAVPGAVGDLVYIKSLNQSKFVEKMKNNKGQDEAVA
ncbi:MAG: 50S ribosomal protein L3 [Deltaproteobacteria bacterium]|nr:50S ribosomal protein L3 [Deltaproteobacteria bacterium]